MDNSNPLKQPINQAVANPLAQYYRKPGTYIALPSGGRFYKQPPKLSDTNELAVYPMTAKDELALKNPDALLNGEALKQVIASVCPDITDVSEIPAPDIDAILVAMRMTSYGDDMEIDVKHGCEESNDNSQRVTVGLGSVLSTSQVIPTTLGTVNLASGVVVQLRPYTLEAQSRLLRVQFSTMRSLQGAEANEKSTIEQKADIANKGYDQLVALSQNILAQSIISVTLPNGGVEVTNFAHIYDWVKNLDRASNERLDEEIKAFSKFGITRTLEVTCDHCKNKFTTDMLFDPTSFFNVGS
jgi:hypothetical protein